MPSASKACESQNLSREGGADVIGARLVIMVMGSTLRHGAIGS
jgi:hypothetical protein